jgi:hypothetical protein
MEPVASGGIVAVAPGAAEQAARRRATAIVATADADWRVVRRP